MSGRMEVRRLGWIMRHVGRLSPAGRGWLIARLAEVECRAEYEQVQRRQARRG